MVEDEDFFLFINGFTLIHDHIKLSGSISLSKTLINLQSVLLVFVPIIKYILLILCLNDSHKICLNTAIQINQNFTILVFICYSFHFNFLNDNNENTALHRISVV